MKTPNSAPNQVAHEEVVKNHQANIRNSLEHRLQVARSEGNQKLVKQLEAEWQELFGH